MANFFSGIGNGFLSLFGMGTLYDPLNKASSELNSIKNEMRDLSSLSALQSIKNIDLQISNLVTLNQVTEKSLLQLNDNTNQFISDSLHKDELFIIFLYILIFVIIFFFLIQKKCC
jgi:hypothetical protein